MDHHGNPRNHHHVTPIRVRHAIGGYNDFFNLGHPIVMSDVAINLVEINLFGYDTKRLLIVPISQISIRENLTQINEKLILEA